jgi:beta-galactosidase
LDYRRFQSASLLECYLLEKAEIEKYDTTTPITTNFYGVPNNDIDYFKWAKHQDVISYDSYPQYDTPAHVNWQAYSPLKRPGQMFTQSLQAIAHGADTVQYFQLKQSIGAQEKFHGAVIAHSQRTDTRVFKEIQRLGQTLARLGTTFKDSRVQAKVAVLFDWENMWALQYMAGIRQDIDYVKIVQTYYRHFYEQNITVDVIGNTNDFSAYDLVVAPVLYMVSPQLKQKLSDYVAKGGNLVTTYLSGLVDQNDNVYLGGYPGALRELTGIWVEETDVVVPKQTIWVDYQGQKYPTELLCDLVHPKET